MPLSSYLAVIEIETRTWRLLRGLGLKLHTLRLYFVLSIFHGIRRAGTSRFEYKYPQRVRLHRQPSSVPIFKTTPELQTTNPQISLPTSKMQLSTILTFTVALLAGHALASPELQKRTTCQACSVGGFEGGAACCSAHVCFHRHEHVYGCILTDVNSALRRVTSTVVTAIRRSMLPSPPFFFFSLPLPVGSIYDY